MSQKNYFFSPPFIGTNWFPPHSFVPTRYYHPSMVPPQHTNVFCRLSWKNFVCCFLLQSRPNMPNTIANQQHIVILHYEGRWNATCHNLSCLEAGHRPLWRFVRFDKICPALVQQVVRTCFCDCLTKCIARATRTNQKTTASLFSWIVGQVLGLKKRIRTCLLQQVTHKWWNLPIVTKFVR